MPNQVPVAIAEHGGRSRLHRLLMGPLSVLVVVGLIVAACGGPSGSPGAGTPAGPGATPAGSAPTPAPTDPPIPSAAPLTTGGPEIATTIQPPATGGPIEIWTHFTGPDGAYFSALVDKFNTETPQCPASHRVKLSSQFTVNLTAAKLGNRLPQVLAAGFDELPILAEEEIISPIDDLATQAGFDAQDFPEAIWNSSIWKDARYGIPLDTHPMVFFYNKALFTEAGLDPANPPTDRESFEAAIAAINDKTEATGFQVVNTGPGANFLLGLAWSTLFYQAGGEWTNADLSAATFNSEAGVQAADYLAHLVNDVGAPKASSDQEIIAFANAQNAMVWSGPWESSRYLGSAALANGADVGFAPVPQIFDNPGVWGGSHQMAVTTTAQGEVRACAYYFIDWLSANSYNWAEGGQIPARNEVREAVANSGATEGTLAFIAAIAPMAEAVRFVRTIPGGGAMLFDPQGAGEAATLVVNGTRPAQEALDAAVEFNTGKLLENKDRYGF